MIGLDTNVLVRYLVQDDVAQATLASSLVTYIKRCLHKDPKQRIPDIAAMRLALDGEFETAAP